MKFCISFGAIPPAVADGTDAWNLLSCRLANLEFIEEIGGGLNCKRPQFTALVDSVVADELAMLGMALQDRWARSGLERLPPLCRKHGCESPEPETVQDWMAIPHGFSSRLSGNDRRAWKEAFK